MEVLLNCQVITIIEFQCFHDSLSSVAVISLRVALSQPDQIVIIVWTMSEDGSYLFGLPLQQEVICDLLALKLFLVLLCDKAHQLPA